MQVNLMEGIQDISRYLSFLASHQTALNGVGDFSLNSYAESALVETFERLFDARFENANLNQKNNPSIDLISKEKRIGVQVTASNSYKKIQDCIEKYFRHSVYKEVVTLYIFITSFKERKYDQSKIDTFINACWVKYGINKKDQKFKFIIKENLIDKPTLLQILQSKDLQVVINIQTALKKQFELRKSNDELVKYRDRLKEYYCDVVLNDSNGMTLKDIYTEPGFLVHQSNLKEKLEEHREAYLKVNSHQSIHEYFTKYFLKNVQTENVQVSSIAVVLGSPGQGKTSFCKRLVYDIIDDDNFNSANIFYVRLKDVPNSKDLIHSPMNVLYDELCELSKVKLQREIVRNSVLVLDGLDELYMKEGLKLDDIEVMCRELVREVESSKSNSFKIVLTSRLGYVDVEKLRRENIQFILLEPLRLDQQIEWLDKYTRFHPETWLNEGKLREYDDKDKDFSYIRELLEQPILLHMMASLQKEVSDQVNRTMIYDQLFTEIIERRYSKDGQIQILKQIKKSDLRKLIGEIAFGIYNTGNGYISRREILQLPGVQRFLEKLPTKDFRDSLKGIMISFYFKEGQHPEIEVDKGEDNYVIEFLHKSLQEFMVAEKIFNDVDRRFSNKDSDDEFTLDDSVQALQELNYLFKQPMSSEIEGYLIEMINQMDTSKTKILFDRFNKFFPAFCKNDFISGFDARYTSNPLQLGMSTFFGVWLLTQCLGREENIMHSIVVRNKVADLFCSYGTLPSASQFGYIAGQNFSDCRFNCCNWWSHIRNTILTNNYISRCEFIDGFIEGTTFNGSELYDINFVECEIVNSEMVACTMYDIMFMDVKFKSVSFAKSYFYRIRTEDVSFQDMTPEDFDDINIGIEDLAGLLRYGAPIDLGKIHIRESYDVYLSVSEAIDVLKEMVPGVEFIHDKLTKA